MMSLSCVIFGHQPNIYRRWMDDSGWCARCVRCRRMMRMDGISGRWPRWSSEAERSGG
jgi:hypothetical protein